MVSTTIRNSGSRLQIGAGQATSRATGQAAGIGLSSRYLAHANDQESGDELEERRSLAVLLILLASALGVSGLAAALSLF